MKFWSLPLFLFHLHLFSLFWYLFDLSYFFVLIFLCEFSLYPLMPFRVCLGVCVDGEWGGEGEAYVSERECICVSSVILLFLFCLSLFYFQCLLSVFIKIGKKQNWPTFLLTYVLPKYSSNFETINQPIAAAFSIFFCLAMLKVKLSSFAHRRFFST